MQPQYLNLHSQGSIEVNLRAKKIKTFHKIVQAFKIKSYKIMFEGEDDS